MNAAPRISVVGMACRYPDADDPDQLWENVLAGRRAFRPIPPERLDTADYLPGAAGADSFALTHAALLEGFTFDRADFGIAGTTFRTTDTVHWLALDTARRALLDAGLPQGRGLPRASTAVVLGNSLTGDSSRANSLRLRYPYVRRIVARLLDERGMGLRESAELLRELEHRFKAPFPEPDEDTLAGGLANTVAGRICNHFDLRGGGFTMDGACASSLLAVADGCRMLASGEADAAIVGGVDLSIDPFELIGFARTGALATDEMLVYDRASRGFLPGEGCGVLVLMRERDADAAGLEGRAVLTGWGVSSDGAGSITRPTAEGHLLAVHRAYTLAGYAPGSVGCFEGHGTGTKVGDTTELGALSTAHGTDGPPAVIGSVKANIGHTKAAAGVAGLIKAVQAVWHRVLPPATGVRLPHPLLTARGRSLRLAERPEEFPAGPVRAGVSAMGFGGINTHVAVEAAGPRPAARTVMPLAARTPQTSELLVLAAADGPALRERCLRLAALTARMSYAELTDLAATLAAGHSGPAHGARGAVVAATPREAGARLTRLADLAVSGAGQVVDPSGGVFLGQGSGRPRITLLLPGQGARGAGQAFRARFDRVWAEVAALGGAGVQDGADTRVAQPRIVSASLAALRVLTGVGVEADTAIGHSLGELTALHWAGSFDAATLLRLVGHRAELMAAAPGGAGAMTALDAAADRVEEWAKGTGAVVAALNGPRQTVVSGPPPEVAAVTAAARREGVDATALQVSHAFHSPQMAGAARALPDALAGEPVGPPRRPVVSTVTGRLLGPGDDLSALLARQLVSPVLFARAVGAVADTTELFVEAGPGHSLAAFAAACAPGVPVVSVATDAASVRGLLDVVAAAHALGAPVRPRVLFDDRLTRPFPLDRTFRFLTNPCEEVPPAPAGHEAPPSAADGTPGKAEGPAAGITDAPADALTALRARVAERAELPVAAIGPELALLDDLHLSSITVGQIVARTAADIGVDPPVEMTPMATATVGEIAALLSAGPERADEGASAPVPGVGSWVRGYRMDWAAEPLPATGPDTEPDTAPTGTEGWQVVADPRDALAGVLPAALARVSRAGGTLLCLPARAGTGTAGLLLAAAGAVKDDGLLVVVQRGPVGGGFVKSLHLERPATTVCLITVPGIPDGELRGERWVSRLAAETAAARGFTEARYRADGTRLTPALAPVPLPAAPGPALSADDVVLVTGGGRGITAECARMLAAGSGGARIAVLGRTRPEDDESLRENLARLGPDVRYTSADVTDPEAVRSAVRGIRAALGPVTVVVHGAGRNVPTALRYLDEEEFDATVRPKVDGLRLVLDALGDRAPRLLLAFGSVIGRSGLRGEAHYAAANEWLRAFVDDYRRDRPGCRGLTLEWSVWSGTGMGDRLGVLDSLARQGVSPLTVDDGLDALGRVLADPALAGPVILASRTGTPATLAYRDRTERDGRFAERVLVDCPGAELITEAELSLGTDPYLQDHVLEGQALLPGVMALEAMAQTATAVRGPSRVTALTDVVFHQAVTVAERGTTVLRIAALARHDGTVDVVIRGDGTGFAVDHMSGTVQLSGTGDPAAVAEPEPTPVREMPAGPVSDGRGPALDPGRDLYGGPLFQSGRFRRVLRYREIAARGCAAVISTADDGDWFGMFHPRTLVLGDPGARDAFLHAVQVCVPHRTLLPVSVGRITFGQTARAAGELLLTARETAHDGDEFVYRLTVTDSSGRVVERWDDLVLHAVRAPRRAGGPRPWPAALLPPLLTRAWGPAGPGPRVLVERTGGPGRGSSRDVLARLTGGGLPGTRRPDGRPDPEDGGPHVSASHGAGLTLALAADRPVGCDIEEVAHRDEPDWAGLLGPGGTALAAALVTAGWPAAALPADHARTAVWAVAEALQKAGGGRGDRPHLRRVRDDGGAEFTAGRFTALAYPVVTRTGPDGTVPCVVAVAHEEREGHA
ncbi:SDR family NAD(P)-dependent oxidoreductase [Streptomyces uncialis]|uniref:SDR family NAD(P)-dependent oxidoreductase n=1 Tax=Streptomyces uncialis TaxID=1048205 RepID=UPI00379058E0